MTEVILGTQLGVTCKDGTTRADVTFKIMDGIVVYETPTGELLKGDTEVLTIQSGRISADMPELVCAIEAYRKGGQL